MSDSKTVPVTAQQLKTFLEEAPLMYKSRLHKGAQKHILTNCYRSLWGNDQQLMQKYFFEDNLSDSDNLSQLLEKYNLFRPELNDQIEGGDDENPITSQRGKQCGHLFKKGESVYRCRNCGHDDTCVMCSDCFHATNHDGHDVKIWISRGAGGCCDCGDPEAWKIPLNCAIHYSMSSKTDDATDTAQHQLEPLSSVPTKIIDSVRDTITVVLDYILETFATSTEDVTSAGSISDLIADRFDSHRALGIPTKNVEPSYVCILWNDEKHSFDAVIDIVVEAIGCTKEEAAHVAEQVDAYGRHIVKESSNLQELISIANTISGINLAVTICSAQKVVREEISGLLLDWLKDLISSNYKFFNNVEGGNCIIRDTICEVLSADWALRPDLAWLSTRFRRQRMPEDEDDDFEMEDEDVDMDETEDVEDIMFGEGADELDEQEVLLDDDQVEDFFVRIGADIDETEIDDHVSEHESSEYQEDSDDSELLAMAVRIDHNSLITPTQQETVEQDSLMETDELPNDRTATRNTNRRRESQTGESSHHAAAFREAHDQLTESFLKRRRLSSSSHSKGQKSHKRHDILDMNWNLDAWLKYVENILAEERDLLQKLNLPFEDRILASTDTSITQQIHEHLKKEFRRKLRLDYLLQFDLRLWKTARVSIKDLLIGTFNSNFEYRPVLGTRFARNYPELIDAFFFKDREPENSVTTMSVQLLTVPTVATMLVKEYRFFGIICSILEHFFLTDHIYMLHPENYTRAQVDCSSRAIARHRYAYTIYDLRYLLNAEQVKTEITKNPLYLRHFLDILFQFQGMDPLERQANIHVEFESQTWVTAFNMTLQTSKLCRLFAGCHGVSNLSVVDASRDLCRSIYRVLKEIADWQPTRSPYKNEPIEDTRPLVRGLNEQRFHQVTIINGGTYEVVEYDIATQPVSFHHPFHWLLSELFENVTLLHDGVLNEIGWLGGFKQMVSSALDCKEHDKFLLALEYPIRTLALLSQINCGVWVRNGFSVRNQALSYRDVNVRESTLDCDIYLLQIGLTVCDSNQFLATLMDRFQLLEWFKGKQPRDSIYDANQLVFMIEDFLYLLIVCATEHGYASGATIEQRVRQSIIQYLSISNMAYSELLKLIPESLTEHESFETQLNMLANFKPPDGLNDKGLYEIKPEYIDEINPYYWHYSRNQREEAVNALRRRYNEQHPDDKLSDKDEFLLIPRIKRIEVGPFKHIGNFLHSHAFCQIAAFALWNSKFHKESKNDTILDEILYLCMLAVTDPNSSASEVISMKAKGKYRADVLMDEAATQHFINFAETDEYPIQVNEIERVHATLLVILLRCLDDSSLSHIHKRLRFIVDKIEYYGSDNAKGIIAEWKDKKSNEVGTHMDGKGEGGMSEFERKKAAAKARQAAIMSQFANAQSKFLEQHADLYDTFGEDEDSTEGYDETAEVNDMAMDDAADAEVVRKCHFPADNCIVCQEAFDDSKIYGMLALVQRSNFQRKVPHDSKDIMMDIYDAACHSNPYCYENKASDKLPPFSGFPTVEHASGLDITSCGHLMHSECFDTYQKSVENQLFGELSRLFPLSLSPKSRFLCPLCKALGNVLIPVVWKGKKESYPGVVAPSGAYTDLRKNMEEVAAELKQSFEQIPGAFEEGKPFVNDDPNLVISDQGKLQQIYTQLLRIMHVTMKRNSTERPLSMPYSIRKLQDMIAYTIGDLEIAQRRTAGIRTRDLTVEHTDTFVDVVSRNSQTLLKILTLTSNLVPKLMNSPWLADDLFAKERLALQSIHQLMPNTVTHSVEDTAEADHLKPLLMDDSFKSLVRLTLSLQDMPAVEPHHLLRAIYLAELTKTVIAIVRWVLENNRLLSQRELMESLQKLNHEKQQYEHNETLQRFTRYVFSLLPYAPDQVDKFFSIVNTGAFAALIRTFTLPFLRQSLLFMIVHHGFIPQSLSDDSAEQNEYDRLIDLLRLPAIDTILDPEESDKTVIEGWCQNYVDDSQMANAMSSSQLNATCRPIYLKLPTQYRMTTLPYRLDQLLDESSKRVCKKCKTVPEHSAICLICGTFVCARRFCCTEDSKGECNTHMRSCGGEIGIYLMIKDCFLLLLHDNGGTIMNAPYLDSHGEADIFLRRGAPQFLNSRRYEQIHQMWLTQSIPAVVRRRMEVSYNGTIWEAF
ncbi:hypothetical protein BDF20DRAFT_907693 [Mycotypha africana]|uniref:uncharacterized protein n=1 Tax=Mycotypha africana TaxID=64632 RepID=UPI00230166EB|nr:uncharacterized protein BDF20DRAFT_907693 [Mycotypha africana]KAI8970349.1 hypothetical protein BDF20DRAFT_907693 [Mycotypha africana]